jgi:hypothetical protein
MLGGGIVGITGAGVFEAGPGVDDLGLADLLEIMGRGSFVNAGENTCLNSSQ